MKPGRGETGATASLTARWPAPTVQASSMSEKWWWLTGAHVIDDENLIIDDQIVTPRVACQVIADCAMVSVADRASVISGKGARFIS